MRVPVSVPSSPSRWTLLALLAGAVSGCMHSAARPESQPYSGPAGASASAPASVPVDADSAGAGAYEARATPQERPGLGTTFGETRYSPVHNVTFERQSDTPAFVASLHYNDAPGVEALRSRIGQRLTLARGDEPQFRPAGTPIVNEPTYGGVVIQVVDEAGRPLPAYHAAERVLLIGEHGQRYALEVENRTGRRFEIVASIDGLDVVDGKAASLGKRGYLVGPYGRVHIDGYRRSTDEVAAFRFGSVRDAYATQSAEFGDRNVGVIGVALFGERSARPDAEYDEEARRREQAEPFPGRFAAPPPRAYY